MSELEPTIDQLFIANEMSGNVCEKQPIITLSDTPSLENRKNYIKK